MGFNFRVRFVGQGGLGWGEGHIELLQYSFFM